MKSTYLSFAQSPYFTPAFNSAIFDGPVRIYFAQFHESAGLKVYFFLQKNGPQLLERAKDIHRATGKCLMILIYPTSESFQSSFPNHQSISQVAPMAMGQIEEDDVLGISGPLEDFFLTQILDASKALIEDWQMPAPVFSELTT